MKNPKKGRQLEYIILLQFRYLHFLGVSLIAMLCCRLQSKVKVFFHLCSASFWWPAGNREQTMCAHRDVAKLSASNSAAKTNGKRYGGLLVIQIVCVCLFVCLFVCLCVCLFVCFQTRTLTLSRRCMCLIIFDYCCLQISAWKRQVII